MGIIAKIKGWIDMLLKSKAKDDFKIEPITSAEMESFINRCARIYRGRPDWVDKDDHIKTVNFAKSVCSETARLATLAIGIKLDGGARADYLQKQIDKVYFNLRHWVEYGCAYGTLVLKPNGKSIDVVTPDRFIITDQTNGEITGIVFMDSEIDGAGKKYYTKLEYHRYLDSGAYAITNKCYVGDKEWNTDKAIDIAETPWAGLEEDVQIANVDKPLYGVLRTPQANNIDINSPLGMPIFSEAIEELKDLDTAYSRNSKEIKDSKRTVLLDSDRLISSTGPVKSRTTTGFEKAREDMKLPDYVRIVEGTGQDNIYQEINPTLNTDVRIAGINNLLSQIGYKCGYSNGYFVLDEKTGMVTATQVESDDRRTIQLIKDVRDKLESCMDGLLYALNVFADLYDLAPAGEYEAVYDFGDITYDLETDRARWWQYVVQGKVPAWKYFVKFEGMTEEEAKAMVDEAQPKETGFFQEE
jgi:A118 family predicted phage portal protein